VIALIAWEVMVVMGMHINTPRALVSGGPVAVIVVFTMLKIITDNDFIAIWAWIGLVLAVAIGYGGWMRWQEHQAGAGTGSSGGAMPPPPAPGGFS